LVSNDYETISNQRRSIQSCDAVQSPARRASTYQQAVLQHAVWFFVLLLLHSVSAHSACAVTLDLTLLNNPVEGIET
jgi:hypothetical protein